MGGRRSRRVVLAMSGGVDSSVAAVALLQDGYEVIGLTLCMQPAAAAVTQETVAAAEAVAAHLRIPLHVLDVTARFKEAVLRPSWNEYARGHTPNPCALCNPAVKFEALAQVAREHGAQWLATGHYARIVRDRAGTPRLLRAVDRAKDQAYFLFGVPVTHLARAMFPLGEWSKEEVRRLAAAHRLPSAGRAESQDACVVGVGEALPEVLRSMFRGEARPGRIITPDGTVLGSHDGLHRFTIGQRRGVGIALGARAWVTGIDAATGEVTVSTERTDLLAHGLQAQRMSWQAAGMPVGTIRCLAQVRYGHSPVWARVVPEEGNGATIRFETPVWAVTPGQAVVLYEDEVVRGGGWILSVARG